MRVNECVACCVRACVRACVRNNNNNNNNNFKAESGYKMAEAHDLYYIAARDLYYWCVLVVH